MDSRQRHMLRLVSSFAYPEKLFVANSRFSRLSFLLSSLFPGALFASFYLANSSAKSRAFLKLVVNRKRDRWSIAGSNPSCTSAPADHHGHELCHLQPRLQSSGCRYVIILLIRSLSDPSDWVQVLREAFVSSRPIHSQRHSIPEMPAMWPYSRCSFRHLWLLSSCPRGDYRSKIPKGT